MRLNATYRGGDDPFEGDRVIELRALPDGALVQRATLTVTPTNAAPAPPRAPFEEHFVFGTARADELAAADWGVTATGANSSVEVDLHARRTLASTAGAGIAGATLTVDVGGLYVELNENGAVRAPDDDLFEMKASGALPGVTVPGFRLTGGAAGRPAVDTVVVRSAPANVTVRLGTLGPFWTYVGDLAAPQTTPDFADTLRVFLLDRDVRDGAYVIPFALHADGVARLDLELEVEYLQGQSMLPDGVGEAVLPFDLSSFARSGSAALSVRLPAGAEVVPGATRARVQGAFEPTRIAAEAGTDVVPPPAEASVAADRAVAQAIEPSASDVVASGFDLFLAPLGSEARLSVNLRADSDGKPYGDPLLPAPLEVALTREQGRAATWMTAALLEPFHLEHGRRYWLVLQALDGQASWGAAAAGAGAPLQVSADGGFSWSDATDARLPRPLTALHRLRVTPERFTMPIAVDVGTEHVTLEEFEPLNRVDFTVDTPKLAQAFDAAVAAAGAHACPTDEHVANPDFNDWVGVGDELSFGTSVPLEGSPRALALAPDGGRAFVASLGHAGGDLSVLLETVPLTCGAQVEPIELERNEAATSQPVMVALGAAGDRAYVLGDFDGDGTLAIADLSAGARVGGMLDLDPIQGLAVAPDGMRLLFIEQLGDDVVIQAVDTRAIERAAVDATGLGAVLATVATVSLSSDQHVAPGIPAAFAAAAAGGETLVAFAVQNVGGADAGAGQLMLVTEERPQSVDSVTIGRGPRALAATADGRRIVVACAGDETLSVVATDAPGGPRATSIALDSAPVAVALSADGARAAVLSATELVAYDLDGGRPVARVTVGTDAVAVAGSARLDALLVAESLGSSLARVGTAAVPLDWVLTSGAVEPRCLAADLVALLGRRRVARPRIAVVEPEPRVPSAISQVVPVTGGCRYVFSFWGLADQPASAGEVLWRAGDCGLARADRVAITEIERPARGDDETDEPTLALHRLAVAAPVGTSQAEVRFTVPTGGLAAIGSVSLRGSDTVGSNEDFSEQTDGAIGGWAAEAGGGELSTEVTAGEAARIANAAGIAGALVQSFAIAAGRTLTIEVAGRVTAAGDDPGPALELNVLDAAGAALGEPVEVGLSRHAFDQVVLAVEVPSGATRAQLRLALPPGAAVELERVVSRQASDVVVPVVFRAEAPGELAISTAEVAYDVRPAPVPDLPATGGCPPSAPGRVPGAEPEHGCCCCADHQRHEAKDTMLKRSPERAHARGAGLPPERAATVRALTDVSGIGPIRARRLARVGIASPERLALADPRVVALVLGGVSNPAARKIINAAQRVVTSPVP